MVYHGAGFPSERRTCKCPCFGTSGSSGLMLSRICFCTPSVVLGFQGASHRLDICTPSGDKALLGQTESPETHLNGDLDTEDEDRVTAQMRQYEHTIGDLMTDIGALKSEVCSLRRRFHLVLFKFLFASVACFSSALFLN